MARKKRSLTEAASKEIKANFNLDAFKEKNLTEEDALVNARLAKILTVDDYDFTKNRPILWDPSPDYRVNV